jgi:Flp pilus assembly secretin CpaC
VSRSTFDKFRPTAAATAAMIAIAAIGWPTVLAQPVIDPPLSPPGTASAAAPGDAAQAPPPAPAPTPAAPARSTSAARSSGTATSKLYAPIQAPVGDGDIVEIDMFVGESRVFPTPGVARIAVGNGSLMTAAALDGREVIIFANGAGTSSLFVWNEKGQYQRLKINIVPGDTGRFAREIAAFLSAIPNAKASVVGSSIIVEGEQLADADLLKIEELAKRYPQVVNFTNRVGWERMISLDVKVVEFPINLLTDMGLRWNATGGAAIGALWSPLQRHGEGYAINLQTPTDTAAPIGSAIEGEPLILPSGLNVLSVLNVGLNAQLNLLAQEGKATLLAQPRLSARSGSTASFIAGGEIPYAVSTRDGIVVQFKEYGIKLNIAPRADSRGTIRAKVESEVSSIDRSIIAGGVPGLLKRATTTEFNVRDGETMVPAAARSVYRHRKDSAARRSAGARCAVPLEAFPEPRDRAGRLRHADHHRCWHAGQRCEGAVHRRSAATALWWEAICAVAARRAGGRCTGGRCGGLGPCHCSRFATAQRAGCAGGHGRCSGRTGHTGLRAHARALRARRSAQRHRRIDRTAHTTVEHRAESAASASRRHRRARCRGGATAGLA